MYSHKNIQLTPVEGEIFPPIGGVLVYKNIREIIHPISHKLSGQYDSFIERFGTVLIWDGFDPTNSFNQTIIYSIIDKKLKIVIF